jgi:APA family basic amino acid/polyamine antiporter
MASVAPGGGKGVFERMFARKSIVQVQRESANSELKRTLGKWNLLLLGVGCIIGAGIFVRTGSAAALHAGPAVLLSFVVAGIVCAFAGLCYAELSSTLPVSGSAYTYSYTTLGEFVAWIMGSLLLLEYGLAASVVAVGWSGYVVSLLADFGLVIPPQLTGPAGYTLMRDGAPVLVDGQTVTTLFNLPAFLICGALAALLCIGVSESAKVNNVIVAIKVSVLVAFIVVGGLIVLANFGELAATNWTPFIPPNEGEGKFGVDGIMRAASIVFFAYIGFEAVSTAGQEAKNPAKDMPFGIIGSLVVCTVIYMMVAAIMTLLVPYNQLNVPDPVAVVVDNFGSTWGWLAKIIKVGAIVGLTSVVLVLMYAQTRIFYTMARDGLLPKVFSHVHPRLHTPWINTILVGAITAIAGGLLRHQRAWRHDLGRNAGGLRHRLPVGHLPAPQGPGAAAGVQGAALPGAAGARHPVVPLPDLHRPLGRAEVLPLVHGWRRGALLRLRHAQFKPAARPGAGRPAGPARLSRRCRHRRRPADHQAVAEAT